MFPRWLLITSRPKNKTIKVMRKIVLLFLLTLALGLPMSSHNDDGPVKIIITEKSEHGTKTNHAPAKSLIECYYFPSLSDIELSLLANLGTVTVSLESLLTGDSKVYVGNSANGQMVIPVERNSSYAISITTASGRSYYAKFSTEPLDYE